MFSGHFLTKRRRKSESEIIILCLDYPPTNTLSFSQFFMKKFHMNFCEAMLNLQKQRTKIMMRLFWWQNPTMIIYCKIQHHDHDHNCDLDHHHHHYDNHDLDYNDVIPDKMPLVHQAKVAVIPLGTGNDLARLSSLSSSKSWSYWHHCHHCHQH